MPAKFERCVSAGGRVRTKSLSGGKFVHVCFPKGASSKEGRGPATIPNGLHYQMDDPEECAIPIPIGYGCTGKAYAQRKPTIAVFDGTWGPYDVPDKALAKVNKRLRWIFSMPIPDPHHAGAVLGILNLDCLDVKKTPQEIEVLTNDLQTAAQVVGETFGRLV